MMNARITLRVFRFMKWNIGHRGPKVSLKVMWIKVILCFTKGTGVLRGHKESKGVIGSQGTNSIICTQQRLNVHKELNDPTRALKRFLGTLVIQNLPFNLLWRGGGLLNPTVFMISASG